MTRLDKAIYKILFECLQLTPSDSCLILVDEMTRELGYLLFNRAKKSRAAVAMLEITSPRSRIGEPAPAIVNMIKQMSAILVVTKHLLVHSTALKQVCHIGARVLYLYPVSEEVLARAINTDFDFIDKKSRKLADLFSIGRRIRLTTAAGTDLIIPIARHRGAANTGIVSEPGMFCVLPSGEASITPDRNGTRGVLVVDGSIPLLERLQQPLVIHIKDGHAYQIVGGEVAAKLRKIFKPFGKQARNIAEFGIGTNPHAILTGTSIEDEKVLGTAHIALGKPEFEGGIQRGNLHLDLVLQKPTVEIDQRVVIENGNLLV